MLSQSGKRCLPVSSQRKASVEGCGQRCPNGGAWASSADVQRARSAAV